MDSRFVRINAYVVPAVGRAILVALVGAASVQAQRAEPLTEARVRALTREAQRTARGDNNELIITLDDRVRERWADFESFPISLVRREDLRVTLSSPYMAYRRALTEYLRMKRPLADVPWIDAIVVTVEPLRIDAPDVERVEVVREGRQIPASTNSLRPMKFTNGSGGEASLHAGEVRFPVAAFAPGTPVTVTVRPQSGEPFVIPLEDAVLRTLR